MIRRILSGFAAFTLAATISIVSSAPASAALLTISGKVTNETGAVMDNVCITVGVPGQFCWTTTNANGDYAIDLSAVGALAGSSWTIYFIRSGYDTKDQTVLVNGATTLNMQMFPTAGITPPVTIPPRNNVLNPPPPAAPTPPPSACGTANTATATTTVYLPNVTKTLGGATGWQTPFIVQNTGTAATDLEVSFYKFSDGSCVARLTKSALVAGTSQAYSPNDLSQLPADSQFSVVVKSFGAAVVAVVNEHAGTGDRAEALSYNGVSSGSTSVSLPNITRRFFGYVTPFIVQNIGTAATTATARFVSFDGSAPTISVTRTVEPGRSKSVDPNSDDPTLGAPGLMDGKQYAVTVTASQPLAVVVNTHNDSPATSSPVAYSTNGITGGAATVFGAYAAKNANGVGRLTTIVVQNLGTSAVTPSLSFTPLGGGVSQTFAAPSPVAAGGAWAFDPRFTLGTTTLCTIASATCLGDGEFTFQATATGGSLAAVVNIISAKTAMGYAATGTPSSKYFLPNVTKTLGGSAGWSTPIQLQSATATGATLRWYKFSDGSLAHTQTVTLAPGTGTRIDPRDIAALANDAQYAVVVDGTAGTVAAIVTEFASGGDNAMTYEGFAQGAQITQTAPGQ